MKNPIRIPSTVAIIEISSSCNAKCRWCTTGSKNRICPAKPEYMSPELFERGLDRLFQSGWITEETKIVLYNWGEPFLHPKLDEILHILTVKGLRFYLSTNGSIYRKLPADTLKNLECLMVSIPGMTKDSYEKIHRLDIGVVHENIRKLAADLKAAGVGERLFINFHVYQFNLSELSPARQFAEELGATFTPNLAYFNDYRMAQSFLTGTMQRDELYEAAAQLFLYGYQKSGSVKETHCRLWDQVCFDHEFNLVPCCRLTTDERLGNLFDDRPEDLINSRIGFEECKNCIESGQCQSIVEGGLQEDWYLYDTNSMSQDTLYRLAAQNTEQEKRIRNQEGHIGELETHIGELETHISGLKSQNRALDMTVEEQQIQIEQLEAQNHALNMSAEAQHVHIEQLKAHNGALQESFDTISNAFFWKITKPARWTLDSLKMFSLFIQAFHVLGEKGFKGVLEEYRIQKNRLLAPKAVLPVQSAENPSCSVAGHEDSEPVFSQEWIESLKEKPLISVMIAAKHLEERGPWLEKALDSLCGQRYQEFEVLLVADPADIACANSVTERYADRMAIRTVPLEQETADIWTYRCKGVSSSRGSLIGFLEQEETLTPNCLAYVLEAVNETPARDRKLYLIPDDAVTEDDEHLGEDRKEGAGLQAGGAESLLHFGVFKKESFDGHYPSFENWLLSLKQEEIFISRWTGCHGAAVKDVWDQSHVRCLAFYLPQFHEIPENNEWWGKGFTEWVNVKKALPLYPGHHQPRVPSELGYYDLAEPDGIEVQRKQIALAKEYGISGFCYYCYWFDNGKRLLEMPLDRHLHDKSLDFPFCLCWANENWTRRWDGGNSEILMPQSYQPGWAEQFILDMLPYLKDERYIRVNGAPYLLIYHLQDIPQPFKVINTWRSVARENGIEKLHISAVKRTPDASELKLSGNALDSLTDFPPHLVGWFPIDHDDEKRFRQLPGQIKDYRKVCKLHMDMPKQDYTYFRTVMLEWDNTPRKGKDGYVFEDFSFTSFRKWLYYAKRYALRQNRPGEDLVFINAWNEWAEGTYLEPSEPLGRKALESTKEVLEWR